MSSDKNKIKHGFNNRKITRKSQNTWNLYNKLMYLLKRKYQGKLENLLLN